MQHGPAIPAMSHGCAVDQTSLKLPEPMKELLEICAALKQLDDDACALATVINVEGSAYRRPGARMLMSFDGQSWGMISGGCLEHDVWIHARRTIESGETRTVRYDSTGEEDILFGTGLGCNGIIDVLIEPVTKEFRHRFIDAVETCQKTRQAGAISTVVEGEPNGHAFLIDGYWQGSETLLELMSGQPPQTDETTLISFLRPDGRVRVFVQPLLPPIHLVIFGGWLDAIPLIRMAREVGFQTTLVDSRKRQSSLNLFREADSILLCSPSEAISEISFDDRTLAVVMNHGFDRDQEALSALTQVSLPFLGMLGPKRRQMKILDAMANDGIAISEEFTSTLHGPVGLDIGAKTPEEIALSIMAEILAVLNGRNAKSNRDRLTPMHEPKPVLAYA